MNTFLKSADISSEMYREVVFVATGATYLIHAPKTLITRVGGKTHRVVDEKGVVHCYPAPETGLTVVRWEPVPGRDPVSF